MIINTLTRLLALDGEPVASADTVRIYSAVGPGCVNRPRDVRIVQDLLNRGSSTRLAVDGAFGAKTAAAIVTFQRRVLARPDGRVDPDGMTLRRLIAAAQSESGPPKRTPQEATGPTDGLRLVQLAQGSAKGLYSYATGEYQWGTDRTVQTLLSVGRRLHENPLRLEVGVGHISFQQGGEMPPHKTHRNGRNVDLRPLSEDSARRPISITDSKYSRERTRILVQELLKESSVTRILFNDKEIEGVRYFAGHHNHLHLEISG